MDKSTTFDNEWASAAVAGVLFAALMELRREWYAIERLIGIT